MSSKIEWTDETWNPATGCSKVSPGCLNCYAERQSKRNVRREWKPWTPENVQTNLRVHPYTLTAPFRWYEPRRVFVCSMGDLFHEQLPVGFVADVFGVMAVAHWHTFQVLTKRPEAMRRFLAGGGIKVSARTEIELRAREWASVLKDGTFRARNRGIRYDVEWPLPNVWLGVSTEGQREADRRIPILLETPAARRFISAEPLLDPLDLSASVWQTCWEKHPHEGECVEGPSLDWVIAGGESGPYARPSDPGWFRDLRDQCRQAGVPFFMKQMGTAWARSNGGDLGRYAHNSEGGHPGEWPGELRVREYLEPPGRRTQNAQTHETHGKPHQKRS
ncbi:MAG: phage Gp37/Gp68 family protein [bacterium]|nr:phage Gp37/Gp68 family protein [bacterium]